MVDSKRSDMKLHVDMDTDMDDENDPSIHLEWKADVVPLDAASAAATLGCYLRLPT